MEHTEDPELPAALERAARIYAEFLAGLAARRVAPDCARDDLRARFRGTLGDEGVGLLAMLDDVEEHVLPNSMTTPHPCYAGLVNSSPLPAAPIADLLVSMLNNNGGAYHQSPAATTAEEEVVRAFADLLGYPDAAGLLVPGGTYANLHGLLLARARHFPEWRRRGPAAAGEPRLYCAQSAHFSIAAAAQVMGLGADQVVGLPMVGRGALDVTALRARVAADRAQGLHPFAVVATAGTASTGAIDDLQATAAVAREHDLWLHVDACYGGALALLDELRPHLAALPEADSVAVDPHKWFFLPIVNGLVLTKHRALEAETFAVDAPYIPRSAEPDAFVRGVATSRRSSGLTVWATLRAHGFGVIRAAVRRNIEQTRRLEALLADAGFEVVPGGVLSMACARLVPPGWDGARVDQLQRDIATRVADSGAAWFSTTVFEGACWLRVNLVNLHTRDEHVERIAAAITGAGRELSAHESGSNSRSK